MSRLDSGGDGLDEDRLRDEAIVQLKRNLDNCYLMMTDERLDARTRELWAQRRAYTAQVLNQLLRDRQNRDWEKRLNQMEQEESREDAGE